MPLQCVMRRANGDAFQAGQLRDQCRSVTRVCGSFLSLGLPVPMPGREPRYVPVFSRLTPALVGGFYDMAVELAPIEPFALTATAFPASIPLRFSPPTSMTAAMMSSMFATSRYSSTNSRVMSG